MPNIHPVEECIVQIKDHDGNTSQFASIVILPILLGGRTLCCITDHYSCDSPLQPRYLVEHVETRTDFACAEVNLDRSFIPLQGPHYIEPGMRRDAAGKPGMGQSPALFGPPVFMTVVSRMWNGDSEWMVGHPEVIAGD
jgi:hypothetical protein